MTGGPSIQEADEIERGSTSAMDKILKHYKNVAVAADELNLDLSVLGSEVADTITRDKATMADWLEKYKKAARLAKMMPKSKVKTFPFNKASNLVTSNIIEAAIDFNARTTPMFIERQDICIGKIVGQEREIKFIIDPETGQEKEVTEEEAAQYQKHAQQMQQQMQGIPPEQMQAMQQQMPQVPEVQTRTSTEKTERSQRICDAVNWDLTTGIKNWRKLKDKEMLMLPIVGTTFKKNHQCPIENKRVTQLISPDLLICDHTIDSFDEVKDKSFEYKMSKNDVITAIETGQFADIDIKKYVDDEFIEFTESHTWLDLDKDGFKEPYVVNIEGGDNQIVSIVPRFEADDIHTAKDSVVKIDAEEFFTCTTFIPDPTSGFMGIGWGILLGSTFEATTSLFNQLIDAGTLANTSANSGLIRGGASVGPRAGNRQRKGEVSIQLGKLTTVDTSGNGPLSNDIVTFPFSGPNATLFQLLEYTEEKLAGLTRAGSIEVQANEAAEMYLARLRESMITSNSIRIRVAQGMTEEIQRIVDIQGRYMENEQYKEILNDPKADWTKDYESKDVNIAFTADPSQGSDQERVARAKLILDEAKGGSGVIPLRYAYERYFESLGITDKNEMAKILPPPPETGPDPLEEMHAQSMKIAAEAEMKKGEADMMAAQATQMKAQVDMLKVQLDMAKLQPELDKIIAETVEIYSKVDKNQMTTAQQATKQAHDETMQRVKEIREGMNDDRKHGREDRSEERADREIMLSANTGT